MRILSKLRPRLQAEDYKAQRIINEAAALVLGVEPDILADWRRRLAAEPTVTNARAKEPGVDEASSIP